MKDQDTNYYRKVWRNTISEDKRAVRPDPQKSSLPTLVLSTFLSGTGMEISFLGSMKMITANTPLNYKARVFSAFYIITYIGVGIPIIAIGLISVLIGLYNSIISICLAPFFYILSRMIIFLNLKVFS